MRYLDGTIDQILGLIGYLGWNKRERVIVMIDLEDLEKYHAPEVYFTLKTWGKSWRDENRNLKWVRLHLETISLNNI